MHGKGLLLGPDTHVQQLIDGILPAPVVLHKGIVSDGVPGTLDVDLLDKNLVSVKRDRMRDLSSASLLTRRQAVLWITTADRLAASEKHYS
jgi:hypothetical protein